MLDLFTRDSGRIACVARVKGKSTRTRGMLEPFRLLEASWTGRGEVFTLFHADEIRRYPLAGAGLVRALYANELLLRTLWQHQPQPELFDRYPQLLACLHDPAERVALLQFELDVLANAGYALNVWNDDATGREIDPALVYRFQPDHGLQPDDGEGRGIPVTGSLLVALRDPSTLNAEQERALRYTLDHLIQLLLKGRTLHARRLLPE